MSARAPARAILKWRNAVMKNKIFLIAAGVLLLVAALYFPLVHADPVTVTPSTELDGNIGSWSDEIWQASDFYQLVSAGSGNYSYSHVVYDPTKFPPATDPAKYQNPKSGSCMPMDIIVTGWDTTGHMHFAS